MVDVVRAKEGPSSISFWRMIKVVNIFQAFHCPFCQLLAHVWKMDKKQWPNYQWNN
jgi:thiol-disulfide isomerase/thioredoxin